MPLLRFRQFSRLDSIQGINIEEQLVPLLKKWETDLTRLGLQLSGLKNDDASARRILQVFTAKESLPSDLLEVLYMLDDLADEAGEERLRAMLAEEGCEQAIPGINGELSSADVAILIFRHKPDIIVACHDEAAPRKVCKYIEWRAGDDQGLTLVQAKRRKQRVERAMATWFHGKGRGRVCDVHVFPSDQGEIQFVITHGQKFRSQGSYTPNLQRSRTAFRPQRHDTVIWDPRRRVLLIHAMTPTDQQQYRQVFGEVYWGSAAYFADDAIYSLAALQQPTVMLSQAFGVTTSRLVEVVTQLGDNGNTRQLTTGSDLLISARAERTPNLRRGTIVSAGFLLTFQRGKPRRVDIRVPNMADYDRDRDGVAVRSWLEANHFLAQPDPAAEDDTETDEDDGSDTAVAGR